MDWLFASLKAEYGVIAALVVLFLLREFWPAIRDRFFPALAELHRERQKDAKEERDAKRTADREFYAMLFNLIQQNTIAFTELKVVVQGVSQSLTALNEAVADTNEDLAAIFAHLKKERPSRNGKTAKGEGQVQGP